MTDNPGQAAPGWYPDPGGSPRQRYFDGEVWTDHYHDASAVAAPGGGTQVGGGGYMAQGTALVQLDPIGYWKRAMLDNYANFSGRSRRAEYWWTFLINFGISVVVSIIASVIGVVGSLLSLVVSLALIIPGIAVAIRRLHDTNRSGWWLLIAFVPIVGIIVLIVFLASDGERGPNEHGPSPKY